MERHAAPDPVGDADDVRRVLLRKVLDAERAGNSEVDRLARVVGDPTKRRGRELEQRGRGVAGREAEQHGPRVQAAALAEALHEPLPLERAEQARRGALRQAGPGGELADRRWMDGFDDAAEQLRRAVDRLGAGGFRCHLRSWNACSTTDCGYATGRRQPGRHRRRRVSSATISQPGWRAASATARFAPTKPAPPAVRRGGSSEKGRRVETLAASPRAQDERKEVHARAPLERAADLQCSDAPACLDAAALAKDARQSTQCVALAGERRTRAPPGQVGDDGEHVHEHVLGQVEPEERPGHVLHKGPHLVARRVIDGELAERAGRRGADVPRNRTGTYRQR